MLYTYGKGGEQKKSIYPMNSRATTNKDDLSILQSQSGKPNPIKHWRKQLQPYYTNYSTKITISDVENPGVSVNTDLEQCNIFYDQVISTNKCIGIDTENGCVGGSHNIRRSGSTLYGPNYCSSTKQYLQRRCKTYEQNMMVGQVIDKTKNLYKSTVCNTDDSKTKCVVYKKNNNTFNTIDSVVASNYVSKRKNDAISRVPYNPNKKLEQACSTCYV